MGCGCTAPHEHVARLGRCICATGCDLPADPAGIFGDDLPERIALKGDPLSGSDLVFHLDQKLDKTATGRQDAVNAVAHKDARILAGAPYRPGNDPMVLEHIHRPFHE
jgi:hypothetical protein